jgi:hypothetical protein
VLPTLFTHLTNFRLVRHCFLCVWRSGGDDSFAQYYREADETAIAISPSYEPLSDCEMIAWRMSTNFKRQKHPLIQRNHKQQKRQRLSTSTKEDAIRQKGTAASVINSSTGRFALSLPEPDTVYISILDNLQR